MDTVVVDACLVITFGNAGRLDLLASTKDRRIVIPPQSKGEVSRPPASVALAEALASRRLELEAVNLDDAGEQDAFRGANEIAAFRDRGDAEVLALAQSRDWIVGSDDAALRRHASETLGAERVAGTLDFLVWAVRDGRLAAAEALVLLARLDVGPGLLAKLARSGLAFDSLI